MQSCKKLIAFNCVEMLNCLDYIQNHCNKNKKGYFVGYITYEAGVMLQAIHYKSERLFKILESLPQDLSPNFFINHSSLQHCGFKDSLYNKETLESTDLKNSLYKIYNLPILYFELFKKRKKIAKKKFYNTMPLFTTLHGLDKEKYFQDFTQIKENIALGNTYQANYTQEIYLQPNLTLTPYEYFKILSHKQATKYSAYISNQFLDIISLSPELFFKIKKQKIITQPMKGTITRGYKIPMTKNAKIRIDKKLDKKNKNFLQNDAKNRSENIMIVDLLRNDLSRICKQGSIKPKELFAIHTYPTLHQMVSTIQARLPKKASILEVLQALFPCGSITGAPKLKTIEILYNLEGRMRGVYCGAIGVVSAKSSIFSIPIRTLVKQKNQDFYRYGVGSGVVWDSCNQDEFNELELKCRFLYE